MSENTVNAIIDGNPAIALPLHIETSKKGVMTMTMFMNDFDLMETGSKEKEINGKKLPVAYMKFLIKNK